MKYLIDDNIDDPLPHSLLASHAAEYEIEPLPPRTELIDVACYRPGIHDICYDLFVLRATDGVSRLTLLGRIVAHYRSQGWPMRARNGVEPGFDGCRPVRGILTWADHCMEVYLGRPLFQSPPPQETDTVTLYVDKIWSTS